MKKIIYFSLTFAIVFLMSCCGDKPKKEAVEHKAMDNKEDSEWIYLFDGKDASGWRSFNGEKLPESWVVEDGTLKSLGKGGDIGGDIVYGKQTFDNFELSLQWKISEGGNSGIFYHVQEGEQYTAPYQSAPEYQLMDDLAFSGPLEDWQKLGADYAMYPADPSQKIVKKAGEWNSSRIIFTDEKVEYWLNGKKVVAFVPWSDDWKKRRASDKWKDYPDYGKFKNGLIGLQDHGSFIWFRDIKIRKL